eukprot:m.286992 g.286992  ORF g.286992 m.286992 type:complete len:383 (-) comp19941_c0_seq4:432-1580(-)
MWSRQSGAQYGHINHAHSANVITMDEGDESDAGQPDLGYFPQPEAPKTILRPVCQFEYNNARSDLLPIRWTAYDRQLQQIIINAFQTYDKRKPAGSDTDYFYFDVPCRGGRQQYRIDFRNFLQTNLRTQYSRKVRYAEHKHQGLLFELHYQYTDNLNLEFTLQLKRVMPSPETYDASEIDLLDEELGDGVAEPVFLVGACMLPGKKPCCFRQSVLMKTFTNGCDPVCPKCSRRFTLPGPQPTGLMMVHLNTTDPCAGFPDDDTIVIAYEFMAGYQGARMENPGSTYSGTMRTAFLPDTTKGRQALRLLLKAFKMGYLFRVGTSITTRRQDTVVWGGIHQKTSLMGGFAAHGWPDDSYFDRLTSECMAHGIVDDGSSDGYGEP